MRRGSVGSASRSQAATEAAEAEAASTETARNGQDGRNGGVAGQDAARSDRVFEVGAGRRLRSLGRLGNTPASLWLATSAVPSQEQVLAPARLHGRAFGLAPKRACLHLPVADTRNWRKRPNIETLRHGCFARQEEEAQSSEWKSPAAPAKGGTAEAPRSVAPEHKRDKQENVTSLRCLEQCPGANVTSQDAAAVA